MSVPAWPLGENPSETLSARRLPRAPPQASRRETPRFYTMLRARSADREILAVSYADLSNQILFLFWSLMNIWESNKLLLFIWFVIPGFVSLKTYELLLPSSPKESDKQLIDAVAYSCVNYALLLWPIYEVKRSQIRFAHPSAYIVFYVFVLLIAPVAWAWLFKKLRTTQFFQRALPHPTTKPWDYVFGQRKPYWVLVTLKDGKQVAGRYDTSSFASIAPAS
jgi:Family of unknown function (DUF6338)